MFKKLDFKGTEFKIGFNLVPPFVSVNKWNQINGYEIDAIKELANYFNFTYKLIDCNLNWGQLLDNGTWDGLEVDIGLGELSMSTHRMGVISFTYPHIISGVSFTTPFPELRGYSTSMLTAFESNVWVVLLLTFFIQIVLNFLLKRIHQQMEGLPNLNWILITIVLSQPVIYKKYFKTLVRILTFGWLLSGFVLRISHSGCVYSSMARHEESERIETLYDLAEAQKNGRIQAITPEGGSYYQLFKVSKNEVIREIGKGMKESCTFNTCWKMLKKYPGKYVMIEMNSWLEYCIKYNDLPYNLPPNNKDSVVFLDLISFGMSNDFQYKDIFNRLISSFVYSDIISYWKNRLYRENIKIPRSTFNKEPENNRAWMALNLEQLDDIFQLILLGYSSSFIIFLIEIFYWKLTSTFYFKYKWYLFKNYKIICAGI